MKPFCGVIRNKAQASVQEQPDDPDAAFLSANYNTSQQIAVCQLECLGSNMLLSGEENVQPHTQKLSVTSSAADLESDVNTSPTPNTTKLNVNSLLKVQ